MKKNKLISAIIFGALTAIQMFTLAYVWQSPISQLPIALFFEIIALVAFALTFLHLLKTADVEMTSGEKRYMIGATIIYFMSIAFNFTMVLNLIAIAISIVSQTMAAAATPKIVVLIVRSIILIAAVVVAVMPTKQNVATIEFDEAVEPEKLITAEAVEAVINQLDDTEA